MQMPKMWKKGSTAMTRSSASASSHADWTCAMLVATLRWLSMTPLGRAVVPEE